MYKRKRNRRVLKKHKKIDHGRDFAIMGINAAGLASKLDTFDHALKSIKAKIFFVQEVKQKKIGNIKTEYLTNFQLFELVRGEQRVAGGGLMIGVDKDLQALQVRQGDDEVECLSVVVSVPGTDIRAVCGYGPQGRDSVRRKTGFWEYLEQEVETANTNNQILIIQIDSNCHAGSALICNDPNPQNDNGRYLQSFMERNPSLRIVNSLDICEGLITRQRATNSREEKAILYLFIVCEKALAYIVNMKVDEKGELRLTNFHGRPAGKKTTYTDHNIVSLNCQFDEGQTKPSRIELFNFKNVEGQKQFTEETTKTTKFSQCFQNNSPFLEQAQSWYRIFNSTIYKCFNKIRSRKRKQEVSKVGILLEQRKKLRRMNQPETDTDYQQQILNIEEEISNITNWNKAEDIWEKFEQVADSDNSASTQAMWKWKKNCSPKLDPSHQWESKIRREM